LTEKSHRGGVGSSGFKEAGMENPLLKIRRGLSFSLLLFQKFKKFRKFKKLKVSSSLPDFLSYFTKCASLN